MSREDFIPIQNVRSQIVNRKVNVHKAKVEWLCIQWLGISKAHPFQVQYCYSHTLEAWKTLSVRRRCQGRPSDLGRAILSQLYASPRPITEAKLQDLRQLLEFIPPIYHDFYTSLEAVNTDTSENEEASSSESED